MKTNSTSRSAFFNPRVLIGFVLCSVGLLLALVGWSKSVTGMSAATATTQTPGTWTATGSMNNARYLHTATLLNNGKVLVAGGYDASGNVTASAELYDSSTGTWTPTASMSTARSYFTATLLPDGKVLVAGGQNNTGATSTAERYDPNTGLWTPAGSKRTPRAAPMAALITTGPLSGRVLVAGGSSICAGCTPILDSAELYDPSTELWADTGSMTIARLVPPLSATTLPDGSVLVVGGVTCCPYHWFNKAESYDPVSQTWAQTSPKMTTANEKPILLPDGRVLVAGGISGTQPTSVNVATADLFDSTAGTWTATASMSTDRDAHTLTLLANGQALVAGGASGGWGVCNDLTSAELYDSSAGTWFLTGNMTVARYNHTATLLPNGQVLVAAGQDCEGHILSSAELYTPPSGGRTCAPPPAGVVSWWAGDGNPEDLYDLNDLTAQNGATFAPGKVNQALSLDGVDDYFTVADNASLNPGLSDFTFEFWVNTTNTTSGFILDKRSGCTMSSFYNVHVDFEPAGGIVFELAQDPTGANYNDLHSPVPVNDGAWHHVAVVRQGATATIYTDGVASASASTAGITNISNSHALTIGTGSCNRQFSGKVDELTYYRSALSASTIAAIYDAGSLGKCKASSFVQSINPTWAPMGNLKNVTNTTTAVDANGFPVNYATVVIKVTDPTGAVTAYTSTTNESGEATFSFLTSQSGTFRFAIKRIFKTAISYDASMNIQSRARLIVP